MQLVTLIGTALQFGKGLQHPIKILCSAMTEYVISSSMELASMILNIQ